MSDNDPVVIVGLAIEAPGGVETADDYWTLLSEQREGLGPFPTDRGWALRELLTGRVETDSNRSTTLADSFPAQLHSILSSSASHRARRRRWTRSSGWGCE